MRCGSDPQRRHHHGFELDPLSGLFKKSPYLGAMYDLELYDQAAVDRSWREEG